jgi:hypothetical protein
MSHEPHTTFLSRFASNVEFSRAVDLQRLTSERIPITGQADGQSIQTLSAITTDMHRTNN